MSQAFPRIWVLQPLRPFLLLEPEVERQSSWGIPFGKNTCKRFTHFQQCFNNTFTDAYFLIALGAGAIDFTTVWAATASGSSGAGAGVVTGSAALASGLAVCTYAGRVSLACE